MSTVFVRSLGFIDHIQKNNLFSDEVPIKYFAEAPLGWDSWGKKFPNNFEEKLIVGYFGNIRGTKQIKSLLMATQMINKEGKNVQLNFAGVGSEVNLVTKAVGEFNYVNYSGPFDYLPAQQNIGGHPIINEKLKNFMVKIQNGLGTGNLQIPLYIGNLGIFARKK